METGLFKFLYQTANEEIQAKFTKKNTIEISSADVIYFKNIKFIFMCLISLQILHMAVFVLEMLKIKNHTNVS